MQSTYERSYNVVFGPTMGQPPLVSVAGNLYQICEGVVFIQLDRKDGDHLKARVDPEDAELVLGHQYKWHAHWAPQAFTFYAAARRSGGSSPVLMHRLILDAPPGMEVDHDNHCGLDNSRRNLKICTPKENSANRREQWRAHNDSNGKYRHVYRHSHGGFRATVRIDGKRKDIPGSYPTPEAARDALAAHKESLGLPA
jgi:hypothetical protein